MKLKNLLLITGLTAICLIGTVCNKKEQLQSLANTQWKLAGIFDTQTNTLKELEPKDCDECYTLNFLSDSTLTGRGVNIPIAPTAGYIIVDYTLSTIWFGFFIPDVSEPYDGNEYWGCFFAGPNHEFELSDTELKLYYKSYLTDKVNYLLYKRRSL